MLSVQEKPSQWLVCHISEPPPPVVKRDFEVLWEKFFDAFHDIPEGTRFAVALLKLRVDNETIAGVGRRVSSTMFWLDDGNLLMGYKND